LPFVAPIKISKKYTGNTQDQMEESTEDRHQAIISLAYDDWETMIELLDIETAMVTHDIEALRKERDAKKGKHRKRDN